MAKRKTPKQKFKQLTQEQLEKISGGMALRSSTSGSGDSNCNCAESLCFACAAVHR